MRVLYFGVWNPEQGVGHYLHGPTGMHIYEHREGWSIPFADHILDGRLLPPSKEQPEGIVHRALINGWTVLSFWDRSGDSRYGSNSAFVFDEEVTVTQGLGLARQTYPHIFERLKFKLYLPNGTVVWEQCKV